MGPTEPLFTEGLKLYQAGRLSEATEAFEKAVKRQERPEESRHYIERIRTETVERIRNRALFGVSKSFWKNKFYYVGALQGRVHVGLSVQELFDRDSVVFRPGAVEALHQVAGILQRSDNAKVDISLVSETPLAETPEPTITSAQMAVVFSYLFQSIQSALPKP